MAQKVSGLTDAQFGSLSSAKQYISQVREQMRINPTFEETEDGWEFDVQEFTSKKTGM